MVFLVDVVMLFAADVHRIGQPVAVPQFLPVTPVPALRLDYSLIIVNARVSLGVQNRQTVIVIIAP